MDKKYYIYIGIIVGFLIAFTGIWANAEENEPVANESKKRTASEEKAIELAKQCNMSDNVDVKVSAQEVIDSFSNSKELTGDSYFSIGWDVTDVSESTYLVFFIYLRNKKKSFYAFHVIPKDNIAQFIRGEDGWSKYLDNIYAASTYSEEKLNKKIEKILGGQ